MSSADAKNADAMETNGTNCNTGVTGDGQLLYMHFYLAVSLVRFIFLGCIK